jgi:uncharacterized protein YyaL (SSP411 family)
MPQHQHTNALIHEKSPYLLQHAHNPVNWRPWNDETFAIARREEKPIFLSIGYATCHWCHVMERESFENEAVARLINEYFVAIKVDREERPDVDAIYMAACQALTGQGGWPLSVFMTPEKKPFFVGTYFPPIDHPNRPSFSRVVESIGRAWNTAADRADIEGAGASITEQLARHAKTAPSDITTLPADIAHQAFARYEQTYDPQYGGFGAQPKFPSPQNLLFLLRYHQRTRNEEALQMVERTLLAMRKGGVFDQIGYGFHRYSTDRFWLLPHFEKMLYDQAMLAVACVETFQVTGNKVFSRIAEEVFTYVLRDMTSPEGGFYSAEDADSEGHEGKFYVWLKHEVMQVLDEEDGELFCAVYNIREGGNFADEASGEVSGENIPHLRQTFAEIAVHHSLDADELAGRMSLARQRLFDYREARIHPLKDDKILTDWNGLMIAVLAMGARALDNALYTQAAERAWGFVQQHLKAPTGRLLHRWRDGEAAITGFLDDYAFMAWGALELYHTTFNTAYLHDCVLLCEEILRLFAAEDGGFHLSADDNEQLILSTKEAYDGAIPSGNSIAATVLARCGKLTSNARFLAAAERTVHTFASAIQSYPTGFAQMLIAHDFLTQPTQEIILAGSPHDITLAAMTALVAQTYLPFSVVALNTLPDALSGLVEQAAYQTAVNGNATAYLCENFSCQQPITSIDELRAALAK